MVVKKISLENVSFLKAQKRYFEFHPQPLKVSYAQAAVSHPSTPEMSTQTDSALLVPTGTTQTTTSR
jgi:hypothetical protein